MSDITVIGLGLMGSALARTLHEGGCALTVWNRSPARMQAFAAQGIATATDIAEAFEASPVVFVCIDNYASSAALTGTAAVRATLPGRTVVQLSSGTPAEVRKAAEALRSAGARYLDGKLLCSPPSIGTRAACIRVSGDRAAFEQARRFLRLLDPEVSWLGENVASAATVDLAWLMTWYGRFVTLAQAARICESEGTDLADLLDVLPPRDAGHHFLKVIASGNYDDHTSSLAVWADALGHIREHGVDAGIPTAIPDFIARYFDRAIEAGLGDQNVMALYKVLDRGDP